MRKGEESAAVEALHCGRVERLQGPEQRPHAEVSSAPSFRRTIRRTELHKMVPLSGTTIYDMERRGEFPSRFNLTSRCVVWDLAEVEAWIEAHRQVSANAQMKRAPSPNVRQRKAVWSSNACFVMTLIEGGSKVDVWDLPATQASIMSAHSCSMCWRCSAYSALL